MFLFVNESRAVIFTESNSPTGYLQREKPSTLRSNLSSLLAITPQSSSVARLFHHSAPRNRYLDHNRNPLSFSNRPKVNMGARFDSNAAPPVTADLECIFCHRTGTHFPTY